MFFRTIQAPYLAESCVSAGYVSVARAGTPGLSIPCYVARTTLCEARVENNVKPPSDEQRERQNSWDIDEHFSSFGEGNSSYSYIV